MIKIHIDSPFYLRGNIMSYSFKVGSKLILSIMIHAGKTNWSSSSALPASQPMAAPAAVLGIAEELNVPCP